MDIKEYENSDDCAIKFVKKTPEGVKVVEFINAKGFHSDFKDVDFDAIVNGFRPLIECLKGNIIQLEQERFTLEEMKLYAKFCIDNCERETSDEEYEKFIKNLKENR